MNSFVVRLLETYVVFQAKNIRRDTYNACGVWFFPMSFIGLEVHYSRLVFLKHVVPHIVTYENIISIAFL